MAPFFAGNVVQDPHHEEAFMSDKIVHQDPKNLRPHPINKKIYEPREDAEFEEGVLKALEDNTLEPAIVLPDGTIIAGHRRWEVIRKHKKPTIPTIIKNIENPVLKLIELNRHRQKTRTERIREVQVYHEELAKIAEVRMKAGKSEEGAGGRGKKKNPGVESTPGFKAPKRKEEGRSVAQAAKAAGLSVDTAKKVLYVVNSPHTTEELKAKLDNEDVPVDRVFREVKKKASIAEREQRLAAQPKATSKFEPKLIIGDCVTEMAKFDAESINLIFTDSPYAISGDDKMTMVGDRIENAKFGEWDSMSADDYYKLMKGMMKQAYRVLTPGGSLYCFCDRLFIGELWEMAKAIGFTPKNVMVWVKSNPTPNARRNFFSATEFFLFAVKGPNYTWNEKDAGEMSNAPEFPKSTGKDREMFPHPTQKPKALTERYIEISSNEGDTVLGPFAGSGTTGAAAWGLKRKSILIEQDKKHAKVIKERIALLEGK
jgi:DNA modification methylase/ParB-like chromosome segregation protein Spo0J